MFSYVHARIPMRRPCRSSNEACAHPPGYAHVARYMSLRCIRMLCKAVHYAPALGLPRVLRFCFRHCIHLPTLTHPHALTKPHIIQALRVVEMSAINGRLESVTHEVESMTRKENQYQASSRRFWRRRTGSFPWCSKRILTHSLLTRSFKLLILMHIPNHTHRRCVLWRCLRSTAAWSL